MAYIRISYMTPRAGQEARVAEILGQLAQRAVPLTRIAETESLETELDPAIRPASASRLSRAMLGEPRAGGRSPHDRSPVPIARPRVTKP